MRLMVKTHRIGAAAEVLSRPGGHRGSIHQLRVRGTADSSMAVPSVASISMRSELPGEAGRACTVPSYLRRDETTIPLTIKTNAAA